MEENELELEVCPLFWEVEYWLTVQTPPRTRFFNVVLQVFQHFSKGNGRNLYSFIHQCVVWSISSHSINL